MTSFSIRNRDPISGFPMTRVRDILKLIKCILNALAHFDSNAGIVYMLELAWIFK